MPYNSGVNFQQANSGLAYAGFHPFTLNVNLNQPSIYKEWLGNKLKSSLKSGIDYCASFNIVFHDFSNIGISQFGVLISHDSLFYAPTYIEAPYPQPQLIINKGIMKDTLNWTIYEGIITAQGNEKYLIIGNFQPSDSVEYQIIGIPQSMWIVYCPFGSPAIPYYFIDDVSLYELNKLPQAQNYAYNCSANTVTLKADTGFNFRWYYLPDTVNVLSTADTFVVDASQERTVLLRATLCSTEFTDTVTVPKLDCTGLEGNALAQGANMFPNPASTHATLQLGGTPPPGSRLRLLDLHGRELRSMAILTQNTEVPLHSLPAGVYVAELVVNGQGIWRRKLCKFEE